MPPCTTTDLQPSSNERKKTDDANVGHHRLLARVDFFCSSVPRETLGMKQQSINVPRETLQYFLMF